MTAISSGEGRSVQVRGDQFRSQLMMLSTCTSMLSIVHIFPFRVLTVSQSVLINPRQTFSAYICTHLPRGCDPLAVSLLIEQLKFHGKRSCRTLQLTRDSDRYLNLRSQQPETLQVSTQLTHLCQDLSQDSKVGVWFAALNFAQSGRRARFQAPG